MYMFVTSLNICIYKSVLFISQIFAISPMALSNYEIG